jgi:hypothetical protein
VPAAILDAMAGSRPAATAIDCACCAAVSAWASSRAWLSSDSESEGGKLSTDIECASFEPLRGVAKGDSCRGEGARDEPQKTSVREVLGKAS